MIGVLGEAPKTDPEPTKDVKTLHAKIGELTLGFEALYRWPNTSKPAPGHKIYP